MADLHGGVVVRWWGGGVVPNKDDILSNFPSDDRLLLLGRVGLATTLFTSIPILVLPTRQAALDLWAKAHRWVAKRLALGPPQQQHERLPLVSPSKPGGGGGGGAARITTLSSLNASSSSSQAGGGKQQQQQQVVVVGGGGSRDWSTAGGSKGGPLQQQESGGEEDDGGGLWGSVREVAASVVVGDGTPMPPSTWQYQPPPAIN